MLTGVLLTLGFAVILYGDAIATKHLQANGEIVPNPHEVRTVKQYQRYVYLGIAAAIILYRSLM